jgi:hypothetical protein
MHDMKLVVKYEHGSYDDHGIAHICIEAESKEQLLADFLVECEQYIAAKLIRADVIKYSDELSAIFREDTARNATLPKNEQIDVHNCRRWVDILNYLYRRIDNDMICVNEQTFYGFEFPYTANIRYPEPRYCPEIYTLEEWWDLTNQRNVEDWK